MSYHTDDFESEFESKQSLNSNSNWLWPFPAPTKSGKLFKSLTFKDYFYVQLVILNELFFFPKY